MASLFVYSKKKMGKRINAVSSKQKTVLELIKTSKINENDILKMCFVEGSQIPNAFDEGYDVWDKSILGEAVELDKESALNTKAECLLVLLK